MELPKPSYNNSAGRLLAILEAIPKGQPAINTLPQLMGRSPGGKYQKQEACTWGLNQIHLLYHEFLTDLAAAPISEEQRKVLLDGLKTLPNAIYLSNLAGAFIPISDAEKALLRVCATAIPQEQELEDGDIEKIRASIKDLRDLVRKGNLSNPLKAVLLELIRLSEDAISRYAIRGAKGLRKAFKSMLAEAAEAYGLASAEGRRDDVAKSTAWGAVVSHLRTFDAIVAKIQKHAPMLQYISQLLLGGATD